ncbi:site-2 protease family protein [Candidatus Pacearchaeota archaeon]|nr:site-2 protease family protein [Candidatus Pacearchaeota archaeon]
MAIFLIKNKKNIKIESKIFVLYRTKIGLKLINFVGIKYTKLLNVLSYIVIGAGYILMIVSLYLFYQLLEMFIKMPELVKLTKIPPIMPLIPYLPQMFKVDFLPPFYFTYWIISIAIIAIVHEFAHGIFARKYNVQVKSTGFGFLGPFLAAFVEPNEKQLAKKSKKEQLAVLSAGSFTNLIVGLIFIVITIFFFMLFYSAQGITFNTYAMSEIKLKDIQSIDKQIFNNPSINEIKIFLNKTIEPDLQIKVENKTVNLTKVIVNGKICFTTLNNLNTQIKELEKDSSLNITIFDDSPALRAGLSGPIKSINDIQIRSRQDLERELKKYKPGDKIIIESIENNNIVIYEILLAENPEKKGEVFLGIGFLETSSKGFFGGIVKSIIDISKRYKDPAVYYAPNSNSDLIIFIANLLWWIILINLSVAIINMLPLGIFDGGRVFFLTIWAITKSKKAAEKTFKFITYILLLVLLALMIIWWMFI